MFVLDASALAKLFLDEARSDELRAWIARTLAAGQTPQVPHLAFSEIGRIIQKERSDLTTAQAKELHESVFLGFDVAPLDPTDDGVWDMAAKGLTYYDAEYVHLAHRLGATLVTADKDQTKRATHAKIKVLSFAP